MTTVSIHQDSLAQLQDQLSGRVLTSKNELYQDVLSSWLGSIGHQPLAIVQPANSEDVSAVVTLAREAKLPLAIRSGGHSVLRHSLCDGIVLDLSSMKAMEIDVENRTAWAESGLTTGEYTAAASQHGLVTGFGDTPTVGLGGITLNGGIGFLVRKYGMAIDDLLSAEIVTADGQLLQVSADQHPDLFWALRGGGGNFGVVTRFQFRLHPLTNIVGGMLVLPATPETVVTLMDSAEAAPDELSIIAGIMIAPPMPFLPAEAHGQPIVMVHLCYAGDAESGQKAIAPLRSIAEPLADMVRPMPYSGLFHAEQDGPEFPFAMANAVFTDTLTHEDVAHFLAQLNTSTAAMSVIQLRVLGGAMARVSAEATAFAHRSNRLMITGAAMYFDSAERPQHTAWIANVLAPVQGDQPRTYVGFLMNDDPDSVRTAYSAEGWQRLATIKQQVDPTNLFQLNYNIQPVAHEA